MQAFFLIISITFFVITSYSIHYTKLYEGGKLDEQMLDGVMLKGYSPFVLHYNFPPFSTVITSYSIHYTKLYEV